MQQQNKLKFKTQIIADTIYFPKWLSDFQKVDISLINQNNQGILLKY